MVDLCGLNGEGPPSKRPGRNENSSKRVVEKVSSLPSPQSLLPPAKTNSRATPVSSRKNNEKKDSVNQVIEVSSGSQTGCKSTSIATLVKTEEVRSERKLSTV